MARSSWLRLHAKPTIRKCGAFWMISYQVRDGRGCTGVSPRTRVCASWESAVRVALQLARYGTAEAFEAL